jgi:hypothetical protein
MSDRALTEEAMLASLRGIDLPSEAAGGLPADIALTIGLAALAACAVAGLLRLFSLTRRPAAPPSLRQRVEDARSLPEADRRILLLHLLRERAPERYADIARDLYRPDRAPSAARVEAELQHLV